MAVEYRHYARWQPGEPRRGDVFDAPALDDPHARIPCAVCDAPIGPVRRQVVIVGPDDPVSQAAHAEGRWYGARAFWTQRDCLEALDDAELAELVDRLEKEVERTRAIPGAAATT